MEEQIEVRAPAQKVWDAWERSHTRGMQGKSGRYRYEITNLVKGERFSMVWKTLFVRMTFHYRVVPVNRGSRILYDVEMGGLFGWLTRRVLGSKIRSQFRSTLQSFARMLEL